MDALDQLCTKVLEHGLPSDNGIRPHINVTVDAETLKAMAEQAAAKTLFHRPDPDLQPATLDGFGPIGPKLLAHLLCGADLTPFLIKTVDRNIDVLDVGRTEPARNHVRAKPDGRAAASASESRSERDEGARPGHHHSSIDSSRMPATSSSVTSRGAVASSRCCFMVPSTRASMSPEP